jgi:hypothetical protein
VSPATGVRPDAPAVFRALFEVVYATMDHFLYRLRLRPIAQTCQAFALAASCLWRLVRIELTLRLAPGRITPGELARLHCLHQRLHYFSGRPGELLAAFMKTHDAPPAASAFAVTPAPPQSLPADPHSLAPQPLAESLPKETPAITAPFGFSTLPPAPEDQPAPEVSPTPNVHPVHPVHDVQSVHSSHPSHPSHSVQSAPDSPFAPNPLEQPTPALLANLAAALRDWDFTRPLYDLARLHPSAASALLAHPGATLISVIRDLNRLDRFYVQDALARAAQQSPVPDYSEFEQSPSPFHSEYEQSPSPAQASGSLYSAFLKLQAGQPHGSGLPESEDAYVIFQLPNPHAQSPSPSQSSVNLQSAIDNLQSGAPQSDVHSVHPVHNVHSVHSSHPSHSPHSEFRIPNSTAPP